MATYSSPTQILQNNAAVAGGSVGNQATSPTNNIKPLNNTLPASQVAPNYSNYINKNGTIYNTKGPTSNTTAEGGYATPDALAADLGISKSAIDWSKITSNPNYASSFGQPAPTPTPTPTPQPTPTPTPTSTTNTNTSSATSTGNYGMNIPNGGTTGVSQGGTIGDLIKAVEDPNNPINADISKYTGEIADLNTQNAQQTANIEGTPGIDLSLAGGREGILNRLFAAKNAALQSALNTAVTNRGQVIQGLTNAGQLNAPVTNPLTGGLSSPSNPSLTGQTTSGAQDISSLIGQRPSQAQPGVTEFYNTQTGQGFSSPQELADFINKQIPGAGVNADNVFQALQSGALSSMSGGSMNPQTMGTYVDMLLNGQVDQIPGFITNNPTLRAQLQQAALAKNPNFNVNEAIANAQQIGTLSQNKSTLSTNLDGAAANFKLALNIAQKGGVNDMSVPIINILKQDVARGLLSQQDVISFQSVLSSVQSQYAVVLGNGTSTVDSQNQARQVIPDDISLGALKALMTNLNSDGNNRINAIQQQIDKLKNQGQSGGNNDPLGLGL